MGPWEQEQLLLQYPVFVLGKRAAAWQGLGVVWNCGTHGMAHTPHLAGAGAVAAVVQVSNYLKDTWVVTLKNAIKSSFKDVGKGWFNLHESNMET